MNKKEFIAEVSRRSGMSEYAIGEMYNISSELIAEKLIQEENIELPKLGMFTLKIKEGKNLFGSPKDKPKLCIYPSFLIHSNLKKRIKNGHKYRKSP